MRWTAAVVCAVLAAFFCLPDQLTTQQAASLRLQSPAEDSASGSNEVRLAPAIQEPRQAQPPAEETPAEPDRGQAPALAETEPVRTQPPAEDVPAEPVRDQVPAALVETEPVRTQPPAEDIPAEPEHTQGQPPAEKTHPASVKSQTPPALAIESPKRPQAQTGGTAQTVRLFGTAAFRGNFKALPKWQRVLSKAKAQVAALNSCTGVKGCPPGATSWQRIIGQARGKEPLEQLRLVNAFFNKWPYRLDQDAYGQSDWWATPQEFLKLSGDCEDYAITKYFALRELGYTMDSLRIVVLKDRIRNIGHAVLAVFANDTAFILDNLSGIVATHNTYRHYIPLYSLNEEYRWSHIPLVKQP